MRKLFILLFSFALVLAAMPQSEAQTREWTGTITDAGTTNIDFGVTGNYSVAGLDVVFTEVTGTSAGWVALLARNGAGPWTKIGEVDYGNTIQHSEAIDSLAIADGAQWHLKINEPAFAEYRIRSIGTGTQSTTVTVYAYFRRY